MSAEVRVDISGVEGGLAAALEDAVRRALATGPVDGRPLAGAEVSLALVSAADIRDLNRRFHDADAATDVLAFDLGELGDGAEGRTLLGDVYVCREVAEHAARELGIEPEEELLRLAIHGVLHLLGHDHPEGEARDGSPMFLLQERLLAGA